MIKAISKTQPKLFCEQYWEKALKNAKTRKVNMDLPYPYDITDINQMLVGCDITMYYWLYETLNPNPNKMIKYIDKAFKTLQPTKKNMTLWRGVGEPLSAYEKKRMKRFNSCFNIKPGDFIYMPEYAFASENKKYSKTYSIAKRAILYEIETPAGSKISQNYHYIFPRGSKFECLENKEVIDKGVVYHNIKLRYIKSEEKISSINAFLKNLFSKVNIF